jgi:hypothetical protein
MVSSKTKGPRQLWAPISHSLSPRKLENVKDAGEENEKLTMLNNKASIDNGSLFFIPSQINKCFSFWLLHVLETVIVIVMDTGFSRIFYKYSI